MSKNSVSPDDEATLKSDKNNQDKAEFIQAFLDDLKQQDESIKNNNQALTNQQLVELIIKNIQAFHKKNTDKAELSLSKNEFISLASLINQFVESDNLELSKIHQNVIGIVDKLFDNIMDDPQLPDLIKAYTDQLRFPCAVLFITEPELIFQQNNAAKSLLNSFIASGLLWQENDIKSKQILEQIKQVTQFITESVIKDKSQLDNFTFAAKEFQQFFNDIIKRAEIFEKRIKEAEEGKAKAEQAKQWAKQQTNSFINKKGLPEFITHMINNAWQHVFYLEYLKSPNLKSHESVYLAKSLIASIQPVKTIAELEKFLDLQPTLLEKLKSNLEKTTYSFAEASAFLEQLDSLHGELLFEARKSIETAPKEEILRLKPVSPFASTDSEVDEAEENIADIEEMTTKQWVLNIFNHLPANDMANIQDTHSQQTNAGRRARDLAANQTIIKMLKPGRWMLLTSNNETTRGKLSAYIEALDKYIIVNGSGAKIADYNTTDLLKALQEKSIRLIDSKPLFERAHSSVLNDLLIEYQLAKKQQQEKARKKEQTTKSSKETKKLSDTSQNVNTDHIVANLETPKTLKKDKTKSLIKSSNAVPEVAEKSQPSITKEAEQQKEVASTSLQKQDSSIATENISPDEISVSESEIEKISHLAVGSWVEMNINKKLKRCRLAAKLASSGKFIFTDRSGIKLKECFAEDLAKMYKSKQLILDQENDLYDQTLASVISNMRNLKSDNN